MDPAVSRPTGPLLLGLVLATAAISPVHASRKDCDQLRAQIEDKLRSRGVQGYSLDIVEAGDTGSARVVGTCDHGAYRIVYARGGGKPTPNVSKKPTGKSTQKKPTKTRKAPPRRANQKKPAPVPPIGNY